MLWTLNVCGAFYTLPHAWHRPVAVPELYPVLEPYGIFFFDSPRDAVHLSILVRRYIFPGLVAGDFYVCLARAAKRFPLPAWLPEQHFLADPISPLESYI